MSKPTFGKSRIATQAELEAAARQLQHDVDAMEKRLKHVESVLKKIAYKPNWKFKVSGAVNCELFVTVEYPVQETYLPGQTIDLMMRAYCIPKRATDAQVVGIIFEAVKFIEIHEAMENFRYLDRRIMLPHPDLTDLIDLADKYEDQYLDGKLKRNA